MLASRMASYGIQMELVLDSGLLYPQVVMQQRYSEFMRSCLNNFDSKKSH